jgi:hypothetical protein
MNNQATIDKMNQFTAVRSLTKKSKKAIEQLNEKLI